MLIASSPLRRHLHQELPEYLYCFLCSHPEAEQIVDYCDEYASVVESNLKESERVLRSLEEEYENLKSEHEILEKKYDRLVDELKEAVAEIKERPHEILRHLEPLIF